MLLIMGLGFQLIHWPDDFCQALAAEGFHVIRFDNRDSGASTHLPGRRYTLEDVADDAAGLLGVLGVESAHVVGASLGGMVGQLLAIRHSARVLSLASMMSTTGRRGQGRTSLRVLTHLFARPPRTEREAIERRVRVFAAVGSRDWPKMSTKSVVSPRWRCGATPTLEPVAGVNTARFAVPATVQRRCTG